MTLTTCPRRLSPSPAAPTRRARGGFTLIELLVVISIIVVVMGLLVVGFSAVRENITNRATEDRFNRLQLGLNKEYGDVVQKGDEKIPAEVLAYCDGNKDRAKAVHTAALLRVYLPERFDEVVAFRIPAGTGHLYEPKATFKSVVNATGLDDDQQSAVLLYLILTEQSVGGTSGDTGGRGEDTVLKAKVGATDREYKAFVDPRGTPIAYRRWAQNPELNAVPGDYAVKEASGSIDPLDPKMLVFTTAPTGTWTTTQLAALNAAPLNLKFKNENRLPTLIGYGKDRKSASAAEQADNVMGYKLNRYGKRGK